MDLNLLHFPRTVKGQQEQIKKVRRSLSGIRGLGKEEAKDIEGIILLELWEKDRVVTRIWIKRRMIDYIRSKKLRKDREAKATSGWLEESKGQVEEDFAQKAFLDQLFAGSNLSNHCQDLLYCRFYKGQTLEEIAKGHGVSVKTVHSTIEWSLEVLRLVAWEIQEGER